MSYYDRNRAYGAPAARARTGAVDQGLRDYMLGVYNYMTLGLGVTGLVAYGAYLAAVTRTPMGLELTSFGQLILVSPLRWVIALAPLGFVFFLGARADRVSASTARTLFLVFAGLIGLSLTSILVVYTHGSIARVFFITAAAFGGLSLYGYTTRRELSAFGSFLIMGLVGLIIAGLVNLFLQSSALQLALSVISVLIFSGLTAWDTQAIKDQYLESDGYELAQKKSVFGALSLYLDFINMFLALLRLFGDRNN
ncbi:MAG TPA: Bax inhibitor-1/YccA family protein [Methylocystis sp.]|nr:Bax inhibitor-1/YccA family protein [Methylocystis sp.]